MEFTLQALVLLLQLFKRLEVFLFDLTDIEMFDLFLIDSAKYFIENIILYALLVEIRLTLVNNIGFYQGIHFFFQFFIGHIQV